MGIFDGPLFDFNGDGKTDAFEFAMAMSILKDIEKEKNLSGKTMMTNSSTMTAMMIRKDGYKRLCIRTRSGGVANWQHLRFDFVQTY